MVFEWDEEKRHQNINKHGVDFIDVIDFFNSIRVDALDYRKPYGENRWISYGKLNNRVMVLIFTKRGDIIQLISFRKANSREVKKYEAFFYEKNYF